MLSLLLSAAGFIVLGYCDSVFTLGITLFLLATVNEAFRPANASALSEFCPPQIRPRGFALNRQAINLGIAVGPALGGVLAMYDYHLLFWADGLTCFLAALLIWRLVPQTTLHLKSNTDTQETRLSPWNDFPYLLLLSLLLYLGLVFYQVFNTWPVYLKAFYHLPESQIGLLMGFNALLIVLVEMPLIHRIERYDQIKIIAFGSFLLIVGFAMMPLGSGFFFAILTVLIWTIGEMLVFPLSVGFIANRADDSSRGRYMGMYTFTFAIAFVFGPFTGTTIYDTFGPELLWYGIGAVGIPVIFGFRFVHRRMK
jgi:MFS family permease